MTTAPATLPDARVTRVDAADVRLRGVGRSFGSHEVLAPLDVSITAGSTVALLGASGSGKSTLLRLVAGLDTPTSGTVEVGGERVAGVHPRTAVVFQEPRLLPWRDLAGNVAFGLPRGTDRAAGRAEVLRWLDVVGLADFAGHRPRRVSGGMAQRAALARALVRRPGVLLLDEPFAALDALTRLRMQDLLDEVQRETGATVLLVTHDVDEALHLADRVLVLGTGERAVDRAGATVVRDLAVPAPRPRDRGDAATAELRVELLDLLGVPRAA
ncbi:ABC transporter related [Kineococcus radiotolerans SRS30216 = ATCC BAA-149]|uniref:ABC transporter related n=1 Tax=Kineococcus radiotolerans (strain ATCC BAA-149 / DSM 14245 / SRS30216) TaxID=266940 RepID=A6W541_KINRD|nr:ABC transporter ATP-binding protein [Kineococcus radiotolerans]ABS01930.1 ABC transporter related [Kineococcus radiotolerans SRS30216 = ATCC BAA-149]